MQHHRMMEGGKMHPLYAPTPVSWREQVRMDTQYMPVIPKATSEKKVKDVSDWGPMVGAYKVSQMLNGCGVD